MLKRLNLRPEFRGVDGLNFRLDNDYFPQRNSLAAPFHQQTLCPGRLGATAQTELRSGCRLQKVRQLLARAQLAIHRQRAGDEHQHTPKLPVPGTASESKHEPNVP